MSGQKQDLGASLRDRGSREPSPEGLGPDGLRSTSDAAIEFLNSALEGFTNDPADSDYQRGYEAALRETRQALLAKIGGEA